MIKRYKVSIISVLFVIAIGIAVTIVFNRSSYLPSGWTLYENKKVEIGWKPYKFIKDNDTNYVYRVVWQEKYGLNRIEYTRAVFRNQKGDYKLLAPWKEVEINYSNVNHIEFKVIPTRKMDNLYE